MTLLQNKKKRKTRAQKKFLIVGLVASFLAVCFTISTVLTAVNLPKKDELSSLVNSDYISDLYKGQNQSYFVTTLQKSIDGIQDGLIYHFNDQDKIIDRISIINGAETKYGITNLTSITCFYPSYENDLAFIASTEHLFVLGGLNENSLYIKDHYEFDGEVKKITCDGNDLFVLSKDSSNLEITRFDLLDEVLTPVNQGYVYKNVKYGENYKLTAIKYEPINTFYVDDDFIYIVDINNTYVYSKDLSGCNFRILFEKEYEITLDEETALENCILKYGWEDYDWDTDCVTISEEVFNSTILNKLFQFNYQDKVGALFYRDNLILIGRNRYIYTTDFYHLTHGRPILNLDEIATMRYDLYCPAKMPRNDNAFCYYGVGNKAIIRYYDDTNEISIFNLDLMVFESTVGIANNIADAFLNDNTEHLYYKFQDSVNREMGRNYLCRANIPLELKAPLIRGLLIGSIVLLVISIITLIICYTAYSFKKSAEAVINTGKGIKKHWPIYLIILPSFALLCLFCYYPGISAIFTSFYQYKPGISDLKTWNNFDNYRQIFGNAQSLRHFGNMLIFLVIDLVVATIPPLIFAFFLSVLKSKKLSGVLRTLLFIPGIIPGVAGILIWRECIYGQYGLINIIIKSCGGTPVNNFFDPTNYASIISLVMMGFPFVGSYLIFYGSMMNIPSSYYEAAEIDGITVTKRFFKIDLPLCLPQLKYVIIMTIIASIQNFSRIWIGMDKDPGLINTPITKMYDLMYGFEKNYGLASAYATVLFVILFGLTFISMRKKASNQIK